MATVTIRHGPRAVTVWSAPARVPLNVAPGPYHGIVPRALLDQHLDPTLWPALAPVLDRVLAGKNLRGSASGLLSRRVRALADVARAAGVRSYRDSAAAALEYALSSQGAASAAEIELWSVKEGHTASVWRLRVDDRLLALNVARDDVADAELHATGVELRDLHARDQAGVVEIVDEASPVLACAWIEGSELHVVDRGDGRGQFIAVECFEPTVGGRQRIVAPLHGEPDSDAIWALWLEAVVRQTALLEDGRLTRPRVEACEGDLMLVDEQLVLVALTPGPIVLNRDAWEKDVLDMRSGERAPVLRWGDPMAARAALTRALAGAAQPGIAPMPSVAAEDAARWGRNADVLAVLSDVGSDRGAR